MERNRQRWAGLPAAVAVWCILAASAWAGPAIYEGFSVPADYVADAGLDAVNPDDPEATVGFDTTAAWTAEVNGAYGIYSTPAAGLSYPNLVDTPGGLHYVRARSNGATKSARRAVSDTTVYAASGGVEALWASALIRFDAGVAATRITYRQAWNFGFENGYATARIGNTTLTTTGTYAAGTTHLLLLHIQQNYPDLDTASLWVDPDLSLGEAGLPAPDLTFTKNFVYNSGVTITELKLETNGKAGEVVNYDEIRFGTSFADVVPEPASMIVLAFGGLALLKRTRR